MLSNNFLIINDITKNNFDNSVRYVSKDGHSHSNQVSFILKDRDSKANMRNKIASNIKLSQKNKKIIKNLTRERFRIQN